MLGGANDTLRKKKIFFVKQFAKAPVLSVLAQLDDDKIRIISSSSVGIGLSSTTAAPSDIYLSTMRCVYANEFNAFVHV